MPARRGFLLSRGAEGKLHADQGQAQDLAAQSARRRPVTQEKQRELLRLLGFRQDGSEAAQDALREIGNILGAHYELRAIVLNEPRPTHIRAELEIILEHAKRLREAIANAHPETRALLTGSWGSEIVRKLYAEPQVRWVIKPVDRDAHDRISSTVAPRAPTAPFARKPSFKR